MKEAQAEIGMVGLGVMGRNLVLNIADHGFSVVGHDNDVTKVTSLAQEAEDRPIHAALDIEEFVKLLRQPRAIILLVPAGVAVDAVIQELQPHLQAGDLIIDAGNSYFKDTDRRIGELMRDGIQFLGVGISGGEEGARHGPSIMPGGAKSGYGRVQPVFEAVAAKVNNEPCVAYIGPGSAGHFVKMVHNGIEYGVMQLIAETYDLMKRGLGFTNEQLQQVYLAWTTSSPSPPTPKLNSYLLEITSHIFAKKDEKTGKFLIDEILAVAKQKGTGMWTTQTAMELQVPVPTIDMAVALRDLSVFVKEREQASKIYSSLSLSQFNGDQNSFLTHLHNAFWVAMISVYAQGMALLAVASDEYQYHLDLESIAKIWRGGCIIRASLLDDICAAFQRKKDLPNLLLDVHLSQQILQFQEDLRHIVKHGIQLGIPIPGLMASLSYFDAYRSAWLPANLIQAQRDYFGSHTYERIDSAGMFHTEWE